MISPAAAVTNPGSARNRCMSPPPRALSLLAILACAVAGCAGGGSDEVDAVTEATLRADSLAELAVINGTDAVAAPVTRDCLVGGLSDDDDNASCEELEPTLPVLAVESGDTLEIVTGAESGGVYAILNDTGDGFQDAAPTGDDRRHFTLAIPDDAPIGQEIRFGVVPTSFDTGSLAFGIATG